MSLAVPTTQDVSDNIVAQLEGALSQTIPLLPKAFSRVLAKVLAGVFLLLYKYAGFLLLQMFVRHATMAETTVNGKVIRPLLEWGRLIGVPDPEPAHRAELGVYVGVLNQTGSLRAGTKVVRPETGIVYKVLADVPLDASLIFPRVVAISDPQGGDGSGDQGNLPDGSELVFVSPVENLVDVLVVTNTWTAGAEGETEDDYRVRVITKFQKRPQGGAYADYQGWGEEVDGIVAVYPYTSDTPGIVELYCEATEASSGSADGVPTGGQLAAVITACNLQEAGLATRRPANAALQAFGITRTAFDIVVNGLDLYDPTKTAAVKAALETAVDEYLWSREPYIVGLSVPPRRDLITLAGISGIIDTVVSAELGSVTSVEVQIGGSPYAAYALEKGEKAKAGDFTYV